MDQDIKPEDLINATSIISLDGTKKDKDMMDYNSSLQEDQYDNSYYYTSEILLSPNGLVGITFEKAFNDNKFKIKEGGNIVDLFLCWEDKEVAKKKIASKFEIEFYSEGMDYNDKIYILFHFHMLYYYLRVIILLINKQNKKKKKKKKKKK